MKNFIKIFILFVFTSASGMAVSQSNGKPQFSAPYGSNEQVGKYALVNGFKMYYEEYGKGEPMFLIHGNGSSIKDMGNQIEYFRKNYRVIIADSRGHGKSELNTDSLTYVNMANDWSALADYLKIDSLNIIGWSDGGIIALLIGINHPEKAKKIVAMGANMRPDSTAVYPYAVNFVIDARKKTDAKIKEKDTTEDWDLLKQQLALLGDQPTISKNDLAKIAAPTLIIAGDKDIIREEHTVELFQCIPHAQLCILPGQTHYIPERDPALFNSMVGKFIAEPFARPDSDWTKK
ncbi:MAG TPA: alpha/beta hydrolase [Bacteroidetes bacterium]|nr:alpha/beta hydrolase [Bacteroidota bacterium]